MDRLTEASAIAVKDDGASTAATPEVAKDHAAPSNADRSRPTSKHPPRSMELIYWLWTCTVLALLPLAPTVFLSLTTHNPTLSAEAVTQHGEFLFAAIAVSFSTVVRMEIDDIGIRWLRLYVFSLSMLAAGGAFIELLAIRHALDTGQTFANAFPISCTVFALSLTTSFFPSVVWVRK